MQSLPPSCARSRPPAAWASACLCAVLVASITIAPGCGRRKDAAPPPRPRPQPEAPPPPPPPPPLTANEVSARLRPLFVALCDHGFNATVLSSPVRSGTVAPAATPAPPPPTLVSLLEKECAQAGIDVPVVVKCVTDTRQKLSPRQARDAVLAIYVTQAMSDADAGNLHRAHVLLADAITELTAQRLDDFSNACAALKRFFREVPDGSRLQTIGPQIETFMRLAEEQLLLRGEDAAVLRAGGLGNTADFTRRRLLAHLRLLTLPLVDLAIARGESYGWRTPADVQDTRARFDEHAAALADGQPTDDAFLTQATWADGEKERAALLAAGKRFSAIVTIGSPMRYDTEQQRLSAAGIKTLTGEERIAAVADWRGGKPAAEQLADGSGHLLLALHWLAEDRSAMAWMALIAGAERLLEEARGGEANHALDGGDADAGIAAATLVKRLNAYRLLAAASLIAPEMPGMVADPADAVLAEVEILLTAWRQGWLKAGLAQKPADGVVAEYARGLEQRSLQDAADAAAGPRPRNTDRYFFFDYRFLGNGVPEVLVTKASAEELVETPRLQELATTERFLEFVKSFQLPRTFR